MNDWLQLYMLVNLLAMVWFGAYSSPGSLAYNDKLNSLLGAIVAALGGCILIIIHLLSKKKVD